ncbi:MAG: GHKL domain-containing protein [Planctomycetes bacterium]|nr:GHKL domain-containing protein [Planctomycetota bacterium]
MLDNKPKNQDSSNPKCDVAPLRFLDVGAELINHMPLGIVTFDTDLNITDCNTLAKKMLAPGPNIAQILTNGYQHEKPIDWPAKLRNCLDLSQTTAFKDIAYANNDQTYTLRIMCTPLNDDSNQQLIGGVLLILDVTTQKGLADDLAAAERLAAVGKLAARVAHELNNPLDGILRYINLALRVAESHPAEQLTHFLQESRKGLMRMVQIISELLEFSRSTYSAYQEADINKIAEDAVKFFEAQAQENKVIMTRKYASEMPNIRSGNMYQVFCNLIKNAIDAMADGGELKIITLCTDHHARIEFTDSGTGLTDDVMQKLFEPFFSTKPSGKGTGLGLAICKDIVERYGGHIDVANVAGGGCSFTVSIPLERTSWGKL